MIREACKQDIQALKSIVDKIEIFDEKLKSSANEIIEEAVLNPFLKSLKIFVHEDKDSITGYYCIGKRALTDGVFDLYWIAVDPAHQDNSVGRRLLSHAENFVKENNGSWILIEVSGKNKFQTTRNFYFRNNYSILTQITDFYSRGNDLLLFGKYLGKDN